MTVADAGDRIDRPALGAERADPSMRRGAHAILAGEVVIRLSGLASVVVVSHLLGPAALGVVTVAVAVLAYGSVFTDAGLSTLAQRRILAHPSSAGRVTTTVVCVQLVVAVSVGAVLAGAVPYVGLPHGTSRLLVAGLPILPVQALNVDYVLQAHERMGWFSATRVATQVLGTALGLVLVVLTRDAVWLLLAAWWGAAASAALVLGVLARQGFHLGPTSVGEVRVVARDGLPYLGNALVVQVITNLDVVVLAFLASAREVGEYGAAYRLTYAALVAAGVVVTAVFPRLIVQWTRDREAFRLLTRQLVILAARLTFPVAALVIVDAAGIVSVLFGDRFAGSATVLAVMFVWVPLGWLNTVTGQALMASGHTSVHLKGAATSAAALAVLLAVLVPSYGAVGAAVSVAATELVTAVVFAVAASRRLGVQLAGPWLSQAAWFAGPTAVLVVLRLTLPVDLGLLAGAVATVLVVGGLESASGSPTLPMLLGARRRTGQA